MEVFDLLYLLTLPTVLLFALCGSYGLMAAGEQIKKALAKRKSQYIKKEKTERFSRWNSLFSNMVD